MPKQIQLKFSPEEAADGNWVNQKFLAEAGFSVGLSSYAMGGPRFSSKISGMVSSQTTEETVFDNFDTFRSASQNPLVDASLNSNLPQVVWLKKSLDARGKSPFFMITANVYDFGEIPMFQKGFLLQSVSHAQSVHIIGAGPAGLFCALALIELGYKPIILERGKSVQDRRRDLAIMIKEKIVHPESNYCFGEGGAGTYSDGKLYTRSKKRGPVQKVLQCLVEHGAPQSILYEAHPHIGTNKLPQLVAGLRETILQCGGEIRFSTRVDGFVKQGSTIEALQLNTGDKEKVARVVLATGHSARDIFELLQQEQIAIEAKPFAFGLRVEHPQACIDKIQYKSDSRGTFLPPSSYSLVEQISGKGVFTFCMCPGGIIAPAATAHGEIVVNGWSPSKRNGKFANSGFVVGVDDIDFQPFIASKALRGLRFQQFWEQKAFAVSGSLSAPAQRLEDFIQGKMSTDLPSNSYPVGLVSSSILEVLPSEVHKRIREALIVLGKKMPAFRTNDAVLVGVESRTSSPVRIPRNSDTFQHPEIRNLYPCGEGAGFAGGIMSAALDGMRIGLKVSNSLR